MNFFPLPNEPATKKRKQRVATVALEREAATYDLFTDEELYAAKGGVMIFDLEVYPNYFLAAFQCYYTKKVVYFELSETHTFDKIKLLWVIHNFCLVGFNSNNFDLPILWLSLQPNITTETLKFVVNEIIIGSWRPSDVEKAYKFRMGTINAIDLIEVAPLRGSLKAYGSRLHSKRLQDLPFNPDRSLAVHEMIQVRDYCIVDLNVTGLLLTDLCPQLELRSQLSSEYRLDLRSKSDAQIAEAVLVSEITALNGYYSKRPVIAPGTSYKYNIPDYIQYKTPVLKNMLELVRKADFVVAESGSIEMPQVLNGFTVQIGNSVYRMGIGGLHSSEECVSYQSDDETLLLDRDVASFYPAIILTLGLYPKHLGENFLNVYRSIVERRLRAKKAKDKVVADSLKICVNGSFGKLGSKYSSLYSPDLLIQVTLTGQLALLLLIESIELAGIPVVSGNTDGIVTACPRNRYEDLNILISAWEQATGFETEETRYKALYSRDVNSYVAVKEDGSYKGKGPYSKPGLQKNPACTITVEAATALIVGNTPIEETIKNCKDVTKFVTCRNVKGGAAYQGVYLGKIVRFYYAKGSEGYIEYVMNGNKVPDSDGAKPLMDLGEFPDNINYDWYIERTTRILHDIAYYKTEKQQKFF